MKDTPPEIERKFHRMLMKRSGEERLKMGCSMHATAQALARASLSQSHPGAHPAELRRRLFLHFYSADFEPEERKRIASALAKNRRVSEALGATNRRTGKPSDLAELAVKSYEAGAVQEKGQRYGGRKSKAKCSRPRHR